MSTTSGSCCEDATGTVSIGVRSRGHVPSSCPSCFAAGTAVERRTLLHHLRPDVFDRVGELEYRFCESPDCDTVYFSTDGEVAFETADMRQLVGIKATGDSRALVCYCFGFTIADLEAEIRAPRTPSTARRVRELVKARACACEVRNPSGRCCLGEIARVTQRLSSERNPGCDGQTGDEDCLVTKGDRS